MEPATRDAAPEAAAAPNPRAPRAGAAVDRVGPPAWLDALVLLAGALFLFFPLHVPYQNPDQDLPVTLSLFDFVRGGWSPISLHFPTALTNLLRIVYEAALAVVRIGGGSAEPLDVLVAWRESHALFRIPPRAISMASGVAALFAARGLGRAIGGGWTGLAAAALLATASGFVRECHHGMFDAPPAAAIAGLLWAAAVHVRSGSRTSIAMTGLLFGIALAFKQNSAIAGVAIVCALLLAPGRGGEKLLRAAIATIAGLAAIVALSPAALLEPARFLAFLRVHLTLLFAAGEPRFLHPDGTRYDLADVLAHGLGWPLVAIAAAGAVRAAVGRERALAPLVAFVLLAAAIVARSSLALNRYALPLYAPLAVLAAYALAAVPRPALRRAALVLLVATALPSTLSYLRLLATEDTRVASARWLRANVAPGAKVFLPGGPLWSAYVAPDLPRPVQLPRQLSPDLAAAIEGRLPPPFPRRWRWASGMATPRGEGATSDPLAPFAGGIVVSAEHPSPLFAEAMTPPALVAALERGGRLLADFAIAQEGAAPVYEPGDLNFAPVAGGGALLRPGPRLRIWAVDASP